MRSTVLFVLSAIMLALLPYETILAQTTINSGATPSDRVLQGIPPIAQVFAPLAGVDWKDFARTLAGICAVESKCDPTYPHYTNKLGLQQYSQYQGLFQMNSFEIAKAEANLASMMPQIRSLAQSGTIKKEAYDFFQKAVQAGQSSADKRFHPEYGMILGAVKHIQIHKPIESRYPGDAVRQASAHMLAQFSGITEGKIKAGQFSSPITGNIMQQNTEAWALGANKVSGVDVAGAVESAGATYGPKMLAMITRMNSVTGGLTGIPASVAPFTTPAFNPGVGRPLAVSYSGVATLMETGYITPTYAPQNPTFPPPQIIGSPTPIGQPTNQPVTPQSSATQTPAGASQNSSVPFPPASLIIAQPSTVKSGDVIVVSWTSVGMNTGTACQVFAGDTSKIGNGNEGTTYFTIDSSMRSPVTFTERCVSRDGTVVQKSASVTIR